MVCASFLTSQKGLLDISCTEVCYWETYLLKFKKFKEIFAKKYVFSEFLEYSSAPMADSLLVK